MKTGSTVRGDGRESGKVTVVQEPGEIKESPPQPSEFAGSTHSADTEGSPTPNPLRAKVKEVDEKEAIDAMNDAKGQHQSCGSSQKKKKVSHFPNHSIFSSSL